MSSLFVLNPVLGSGHGRVWAGCKVPPYTILHGSADPRLSTLCHVARMLFSAIRLWMEEREQVPAVSLCVSSTDTLCQPSVQCTRCQAGVGEPSCQLQIYLVGRPIAPPDVSPLHGHVYYRLKFWQQISHFQSLIFFFNHKIIIDMEKNWSTSRSRARWCGKYSTDILKTFLLYQEKLVCCCSTEEINHCTVTLSMLQPETVSLLILWKYKSYGYIQKKSNTWQLQASSCSLCL